MFHATSFAYLNERNAIWCFLRSALRGHPEAEYKMGLGYLNGQLGLDRDYRKAETWLNVPPKMVILMPNDAYMMLFLLFSLIKKPARKLVFY
jgi:hypothetical protein